MGRSGGQQFVMLATACTTGNVIHEIGHTIGLYHEQMRTDRDANGTVNWANVQAGKEGNFNTVNPMVAANMGKFDFDSIMLYGSYIFSGNGLPTMVRKDGTTFAGSAWACRRATRWR